MGDAQHVCNEGSSRPYEVYKGQGNYGKGVPRKGYQAKTAGSNNGSNRGNSNKKSRSLLGALVKNTIEGLFQQ
jgi:hypothetical protein